MNRQQAINYLLSSGFSEEQINTIEQAFKQEPTTKNDNEQEDITWIIGNDNVQIAVRNMPIDMMQKICSIIGNTKNDLGVQ